jgi:hypothetical protein
MSSLLYFPVDDITFWNVLADSTSIQLLQQDIEAMKQRVKEMEAEAARLREMQAQAERDMNMAEEGNDIATTWKRIWSLSLNMTLSAVPEPANLFKNPI